MPRLFVAVWPPPGVVDAVAALERPPTVGLRWTRLEQWHVTLRFLGRIDDVAPVEEALRMVAAETPVVEATVGPAVGRFGHRVLHVPVEGLGPVADAVIRATAHLGEPPEDRPFAGHLTLARAAKGVRVDLRPLAGQAISGRWPVGEVTLVDSQLSPKGAQYQVVERFALRR
jgi:2'-5' RNA ligase